MLSAAGSALVAGSVLEESMKTRTVRVLRAFFIDRNPVKVGAVLDLPETFALELIAAKKAEPAEKPEEKPAEKPADDGKGQSNTAKAKGGKDAG